MTCLVAQWRPALNNALCRSCRHVDTVRIRTKTRDFMSTAIERVAYAKFQACQLEAQAARKRFMYTVMRTILSKVGPESRCLRGLQRLEGRSVGEALALRSVRFACSSHQHVEATSVTNADLRCDAGTKRDFLLLQGKAILRCVCELTGPLASHAPTFAVPADTVQETRLSGCDKDCGLEFWQAKGSRVHRHASGLGQNSAQHPPPPAPTPCRCACVCIDTSSKSISGLTGYVSA